MFGLALCTLATCFWWDSAYFNDVGQYYITPFFLFLALGFLVAIVGFIGCWGSFRQSRMYLLIVRSNQIASLNHKIISGFSIFYFRYCCVLVVVHHFTGHTTIKPQYVLSASINCQLTVIYSPKNLVDR